MNQPDPAADIARILLTRLLRQRGAPPAVLAAGLAVRAGCAVAAVLCFFGGFICVITAIWIFAAGRIGAAGAPLVVAAILSALGGGLLVVRHIRRRPANVTAAAGDDTPPDVAELLAAFQHNKRAALLAALLAGVQAGSARG